MEWNGMEWNGIEWNGIIIINSIEILTWTPPVLNFTIRVRFTIGLGL